LKTAGLANGFLLSGLRKACLLQVRETSPDLVWTQPQPGCKLLEGALTPLELTVDLGAKVVSEFIDSKCRLL
jgi:hypothetical protein